MEDQLSMFPLMMSEASLNAIGSPESAGGHAHFASPGGLTTNPSGPDHPRASPSAQQDSSAAVPTSDTLPLTSPSSSPASDRPTSSGSKSPARLSSESLQKALEERLQANLNGLGSMIYSGVWKPHTTPAGRQIYRLRASARRISASEHSSSASGWPTPSALMDGGNTGDAWEGRRERVKEKHGNGNGFGLILPMAAQLAGWVTASARDWKDTAGMATEAVNPDGSTRTRLDQLPRQAQMAGWPTPQEADGLRGSDTLGRGGTNYTIKGAAKLAGWATPVGQQANGTPERFLERKRESMERGAQSMGISLSDLNMQAQAWAGWPTPTALERNADPETMQKRRDFRKENANQSTVPMYLNEAAQITTDAEMCEAMGYPATLDGPARLLADGTILTGSSAGMESGGQLNPRFSGFLMGYPTEWCEAAISCQLATPSRKKAKPTPDAP